jgi:hypothetical protein
MQFKNQLRFTAQLLPLLVGFALVFSACSPANQATGLPEPTATSAPVATSTPTVPPEPTVPAASTATQVPAQDNLPGLSLDTGSLATGFQVETVPAASAGETIAAVDVLPAYIRATLQGYPILSSAWQPQIFIYPIAELAKTNEAAGKVIASLQTLIQSPQEIPLMPFLPLTGDVQRISPQIQYLDFKNGQGLRYLTDYGNGISPINNSGLIYTYQGITGDGKYYVAAVLPVNHSSLPADDIVTGNEPPEFRSDYKTYLANVDQDLFVQAPGSFNPDLTLLDAMLSSLEIK